MMVVSLLKRLVGGKKVVLEAPALVEDKDIRFPGDFNPYTLMEKSLRASGWFNDATGELFKGFTVSKEDMVLDAGCGGGSNALFCARQGAHIVFADIDPAMVEETGRLLQATAARQVEAVITDANPLPMADETFTRIVSTEVIEHVAEPAAFLRELVRVGKPGALYLLAVPDASSEGILKRVAHPSYFEHPNHIRVVGREEFAQMVSAAGLEIVSHDLYGFFFTVWWSLYWSSHKDGLTPTGHATLNHWAATWEALLQCEHGMRVKEALDLALPKSQVIIARKR
ncbi:class I SAM-dependent methyltransferase [Collimonas sp. NPDC087041]|uniref:class I SAM-dependent methyltransferase n=1 Tax=Collimonas sp. NPDC087041 TaxID=3363960 RepID=UPI003824C25D